MVKKILNISFYLLLLFYIIWETYWYNQVGLTFIKWHTHFVFPFVLFLGMYYLLRWRKASQKVFYILYTIFFIIFSFELVVQITGIGKTPVEKLYGHYDFQHQNGSVENYYHIGLPNAKRIITNREVIYSRHTNSLGFSDVEWSVEKDTDEIRILCLGDSFTEGDGTPYDSTYVKFLEDKFHATGLENVTIMNAGSCGSDPFFGYMNYKDRLHKFKPDIVLQTIFSQDLDDDIPRRDGLERFRENYLLDFQEKNKLGKLIYGISYFSRPFFKILGYNDDVQKNQKESESQMKVKKSVGELTKKYYDLIHQNNSQLIFITFPLQYELEDNKYKEITQEVLSDIKMKYYSFDLFSYYQKTMQSNYSAYYWQGDGHHNSKGYKIMADAIYEQLEPMVRNLLKQ